MTYSELTNMSAAILPDMMRYSNEVTSGWFGIGVLGILWFILFLNLMFADRDKALSTATFIVGLLSVPLRFLSVVPDKVMFVAVGLAILALLFMFFKKEDV